MLSFYYFCSKSSFELFHWHGDWMHLKYFYQNKLPELLGIFEPLLSNMLISAAFNQSYYLNCLVHIDFSVYLDYLCQGTRQIWSTCSKWSFKLFSFKIIIWTSSPDIWITFGNVGYLNFSTIWTILVQNYHLNFFKPHDGHLFMDSSKISLKAILLYESFLGKHEIRAIEKKYTLLVYKN